MDEPETTVAPGTTEPAETETTPTVETPPGGDVPEMTETGGGGEGTGGNEPGKSGEGKGEGPVPYARFKEVNEERKAFKTRLEELERKFQSLDKPKDAPPPEPKKAALVRPPQPITDPDELFDFYATQVVDRRIKEIFGDPTVIKQAAVSYTESTQERVVREFNEAASARGLDPSNEPLRVAVAAALSSGKYNSMGSAIDSLFVAKPKAPETPAKPNGGNGAARDGMSPTGLTRVTDLPMTKEEAMALTKQGKVAPQVSVMDILKRDQKRA